MKKKRKKRRNLFAGISAGALMLAAAGLLLLSYLSVVVNPAKVWFFSVFGLLFFPLLILNIVLLGWAAVRRSRLCLIPLLAVLPSLLFVGRYVRFGKAASEMPVTGMQVTGMSVTEATAAGSSAGESSDAAAAKRNMAPSLKIITYNVGRFSYRRDMMSARMCTDSVFAYLHRQDADIICLQEYATSNPDRLKSLVRSRMPGYGVEYYLRKGRSGIHFGNVTLSRLPSVGKGKLLFEDSSNLALYSDYSTGGRKFRVYNCHFESYAISMTHLWKSLTGDREILQQTENKYRRSIVRRPKQVGDVLAHIEKSPVEAFVCGDFNDNPMSYTYHRIGRGRKDTFVESGRGFGASYSAFWPMLRIDYIFIPEDWQSSSHRTDRVIFSDHFPVAAELTALE